MTNTPLLPRQKQKIISEVKDSSDNPIFMIIYDTQSTADIAEFLTGVRVESYEIKKDGVAHFRLSNYLPTGEILIEALKEIVPVYDWVFLHTGCSICPEIVLEFFDYLCQQRFSKPRIVVIGEKADVLYGEDERMKKLFGLGRLADLTLEGIQ